MASSFSIDTSLASDVVDSLKQTKNSLAIGNETLSLDNEYARQVAEKIIQLQNEIEQDYNTAINTLEKTITRTKQVENKLTNKARIELESANELVIESITTVSSMAETDSKSTSFEDSNSDKETNINSDSSSNFANETTNITNKKTPLANKKTTQERITNDNFEEIKKEVEILKGATLVNTVTGDEITTGEELVQYMNEDSELQESFKQIAEIQRNNGKTIGSDVNQDELIKEENIEKYRELFDSADKKSNQIRIAEDNFEEIKNEIETLNGTTLINSKTGNEVTTGEELVEYMIKDANIKKYRKLFDSADKKTTQSRITEDNIEDFADEYEKKYQEYIDKCIKVYKKYRKMGAIGKETTAARISNDLNENYAEEIKSEIERYDTYKKLYDIYEKGRETTGARIFNDNTEDVIYAEMVKAAEKEEAEKRAQLEEEKENCWWDIVESILLSKAEGIFDTVVFGVNLFTSAVEWYDSLAAHQSREEYEKEKEEKWNNVYAYIAEENVKNLLYDVKVGILGGVEGALKFGEDVADGLWILINKLTSAVEWYDSLAAHQSREEYEKEKEEKWNEINTYVAEDHVGTWFNGFYDETLYGQILKEFSSNFEMVRELGNSAGYLGASIVSSALLTNAVGAVGGTVSKVGARVIKASTFATAQLGSATGDAWLSGASYDEALRQGFTTAGYRFIDMYTGDLIGEYLPFGTDTVEAIVKNAGVHIAIDTGIGAIDGVVSPLIQSISTPSAEVLKANGYNPSAEELAAHGGNIVETYRDSSFADKYSYNFNANGGWKGVAKNAAAGGVMSAISEVIGGIKDVKDIKKATEVYDKMNAVSSELNEVVSNARQMNYDSNLATEVYDTNLVKYGDLLQQRDEILTAYDNLTPSQQYIFQLKTIKDEISSSSDGVGKAFMSSDNNMGAIWKELNNSDRLALIDTMDESQIKTLFSVVGGSNAQKFLDMNSDYFNGRFFTSDATDSFFGLTSGLTSTTDFTSDISFNVDTSIKTVDSDLEVKGAAQDIKVDTDLPNTKTDADTSKAFTDTDSKIRQYENSVADAEEVYLQIADDAIDDLGTTETAINTSKNRALSYLDEGSDAGAISDITDGIDDLDEKSKKVIEDLVGVTATTTSADSSYRKMFEVIEDTRKEISDKISELEQKSMSASKKTADAYGELIEGYKKLDGELIDVQNKLDIGKESLDESINYFRRDILGETLYGNDNDVKSYGKQDKFFLSVNSSTSDGYGADQGGIRELGKKYGFVNIESRYSLADTDYEFDEKTLKQIFTVNLIGKNGINSIEDAAVEAENIIKKLKYGEQVDMDSSLLLHYFLLQTGDIDTGIEEFNKAITTSHIEFKSSSDEINYLHNYLTSEGFVPTEAKRILEMIDSTGVCTYTTKVNEILYSFRDNPEAFEKAFGYPMYIKVDGQEVLNSNQLLLDLYTYMNVDTAGGKLFSVDENGLLHLANHDTINQIYMNLDDSQKESFNKFLSEKGITRKFSKEKTFYGINKETIAGEIQKKLDDGQCIEIIIYGPVIEQNFAKDYNVELGENNGIFKIKNVETGEIYEDSSSWGNSGHSMFVTGVNDNGIVVETWGLRGYIDEESLHKNFITMRESKIDISGVTDTGKVVGASVADSGIVKSSADALATTVDSLKNSNVESNVKTIGFQFLEDENIFAKEFEQGITFSDVISSNTRLDVDTQKTITDSSIKTKTTDQGVKVADTDSKIRQYEINVANAEEDYLQIVDETIDEFGLSNNTASDARIRAESAIDAESNPRALTDISDGFDDLDKKTKKAIEDLVEVTVTTDSPETSYKKMIEVVENARKEIADTIDGLEQKSIGVDKKIASAYSELIDEYRNLDGNLIDVQTKLDFGKESLDETIEAFGKDILGETDSAKISDIIDSSKNANIDVVDSSISRNGSRELTTDYIREKYGIEISDDSASEKIGLQFFAEKGNDIDNSTSVLSEEFIKEQAAMDGGVSYFEKKLSELIESKYSNDSSKNVLDKFKNKLLLTLEKNKLTKQIGGDFNLFVSQLPSETINELFEKNPELTEIVYLNALNNLLTKENVSGNLKAKILSRNLQTSDNFELQGLANRYFYLIDSGEIDIKEIDTELLKDFVCLDLVRLSSEHPIIEEYFSRENFDQKYLKTILEDRGNIFTDETAQSIISRFKKELVQRYPDFNLSDLPLDMYIRYLQNIESYVSNYEYVLAHQDIVEKIFSNHMEYSFNFELLRDDNLELFDFDFIKENYDYMNSRDYRSSNPFVGKYREIMNIGCDSKAKKIYKEIVSSFDDESYLSKRVKTNILLARLSEFMKTSEFDNLDLDTFNRSDYIELYNYLLDGYNAALLYDADFKGVNYNGGEMISKKLGITFEKNYRTKYNAKCDELFAKTVDISEAKDILYMKYFETTRSTITSIMDRYGENFSKVMQFDESGGATEFIKLIETIEKCDDLATIREIYYDSQTIFYTQEMLIRLQNEVKQTYAKSILDVLKQTKEKVDVQLNSNTGVTYLSRGGKNIPIVKMQGDFNLLVHSTAAYGKMETIDGSYLKSWNNNKSNPNHGICCSLIGNNLLGMAPVANGGVMFGFFDFSPEALSDFSPYDLASSNHDYLLYTTWNPKYVSGTELIDNTRHGHNEIVIERRELRDIKSSYTAIQPDFLVYAPSNSGDNNRLLENTLNAASEMNIPVLTVDFEEIIDMEVENIYGLIDTFEDTKDLAQLHKALSAYETGRFDREHYLENNYGQNIREKLTNSFVNYIDYLKTLSDKKYVDGQFEQLREIISIEQSKYNSTPSHLTINSGSLMDYNMILKRMED